MCVCVCVFVQIVSVAKWRGGQLAEVVQGTGAHAWVELTDLFASSYSITVAQVLLSCKQHDTVSHAVSFQQHPDINEQALHTFTDTARSPCAHGAATTLHNAVTPAQQ